MKVQDSWKSSRRQIWSFKCLHLWGDGVGWRGDVGSVQSAFIFSKFEIKKKNNTKKQYPLLCWESLVPYRSKFLIHFGIFRGLINYPTIEYLTIFLILLSAIYIQVVWRKRFMGEAPFQLKSGTLDLPLSFLPHMNLSWFSSSLLILSSKSMISACFDWFHSWLHNIISMPISSF